MMRPLPPDDIPEEGIVERSISSAIHLLTVYADRPVSAHAAIAEELAHAVAATDDAPQLRLVPGVKAALTEVRRAWLAVAPARAVETDLDAATIDGLRTLLMVVRAHAGVPLAGTRGTPCP